MHGHAQLAARTHLQQSGGCNRIAAESILASIWPQTRVLRAHQKWDKYTDGTLGETHYIDRAAILSFTKARSGKPKAHIHTLKTRGFPKKNLLWC